MLRPPKPDCIPLLDLGDLPGYETTDSEGEHGEDEYEEEENATEPGNYFAQDKGKDYPEYQGMPLHESMRYISDFHDRYRPASENRAADAHSEM